MKKGGGGNQNFLKSKYPPKTFSVKKKLKNFFHWFTMTASLLSSACSKNALCRNKDQQQLCIVDENSLKYSYVSLT